MGLRAGDVVRYVDANNVEFQAVLLADVAEVEDPVDLQVLNSVVVRLAAMESQIRGGVVRVPDETGKVKGVISHRLAGGGPYWVP